MSPITTHVLDTALGKPAAGVAIKLSIKTESGWQELARGSTDKEGRARELLGTKDALKSGTYRLSFDLEGYFKSVAKPSFFPEACLEFKVDDATQHYHVPLLVSGFGYSTYRGT